MAAKHDDVVKKFDSKLLALEFAPTVDYLKQVYLLRWLKTNQ